MQCKQKTITNLSSRAESITLATRIMKTLVSKTAIREAIKTQNVQNLYKFAHLLNMNVSDLIRSSKAARKFKSEALYAVGCTNAFKRFERDLAAPVDMKTRNAAIRREIFEYLREELKKPVSPYTKVAMLGRTRLFFCSPVLQLYMLKPD